MKFITATIICWSLLAVFPQALAREIVIEALFTDKAMIKLDGKRQLLKAGEPYKGLTLISTDTYRLFAEIEIDGQRDIYELGRHIGGGYTTPKTNQLMISADRRGSYFTHGQINGRSINFLIDTGASSVAINENLARSLDLDYMNPTRRLLVETAAGMKTGYRVVLNEVTIGGISLYNVQGTVISGDSPSVPLLGMSFLSQLEIEKKQNLMILRKP